MSFARRRPRGAFPALGPITYLYLSVPEVERALETGPYRPMTRWFHATTREVAALALEQGLTPSCWRHRDTCAIFGYDSIDDLPAYRQSSWILEIESAALTGQLKAWWAPARSIRAVWHKGRRRAVAPRLIYPELRGQVDGCACELSELTRAEQLTWRRQIRSGPHRS
jgi:hypothetical protein